MLYTSAEANKLLKTLLAEIGAIRSVESRSETFNAASTEDPETLRPDYDFAGTQARLEKLERDVRIVKHAINEFNITHTLPGFDDLTIDMALVYIPQLTERIRKLRMMATRLPKERGAISPRGGSIIDYTYTNYDIDEAREAFRDAERLLNALHLALDMVNSGDKMEIDLDIDWL